MRVLVACEFSGIVRDAFIAKGHDAISCDLLPTERPGPHIQGDVRELLQEPWDLVIAHPPCNALTNYMTCWKPHIRFYDWPKRVQEGVALFQMCLDANAPMVAVENPPLMNRWAKLHLPGPDQRTDFCHFGDNVKKQVGLWLEGLPPLMSTISNPDAPYLLRERGSRKGARAKARHGITRDSKERAKFQPGIAAAMALQWGGLDTNDANA